MTDHDYEIYKGKSFSDLCKDIVKNSEEKRSQLDILTTDLRDMIKTIPDAVMIVPLLKEYIDSGIRNDEQLIKLAAVIQRIMGGLSVSGDGGVLLTDEEKKQLMDAVEVVAKDVKGIDVTDKTAALKDSTEKSKK